MKQRPRTLCRTSIVAAWALLVVPGCADSASRDVRVVTAEKSTDGTGIVALWLKYREREEPFAITVDHAFLIDWDEKSERRRFFVYDRPSAKVQIPGDYDAFLRCLDGLPRDGEVGWINTCCAPISYGMSDEDCERLERVISQGNRRLLFSVTSDDDDFGLVCTCESDGIRFPGD
jgi:hypothetical protein